MQTEQSTLSAKFKLVDGTIHGKLTACEETCSWADGPVIYRAEVHGKTAIERYEGLHHARIMRRGSRTTITGELAGLQVRHTFNLSGTILAEELTLHNPSKREIRLDRLEIGMTWPLTNASGGLHEAAQAATWIPVPARKHPLDENGGYDDFTAQDLISRRPDAWFGHMATDATGKPRGFNPVDAWIADGWCFSQGNLTLLALKHANGMCEFCPIDAEAHNGTYRLRFGGFTIVHPTCMIWDWIRQKRVPHPMPGKATCIGAGASVNFGLSRYELVAGDWQRGYATFRNYFDGQGFRPPEGFNPPVHWNQLYDMTSWHTVKDWSGGPRRELYTLDALYAEAQKAKDYHCEALYLDPSWDTKFASSIWDEKRLGPQREFVNRLWQEYGLKLSLHSPLAMWCDPSTYPETALRMDANGKRIKGELCSGSRQYLETKAARHRQLCEDGASFIMFDGTIFTGPCYDKRHGHPIPYTPDDQAAAYQWLCDDLLAAYPDTLIELHDVFAGGASDAMLPKHFPHRPGWNVENWGNEYMWHTQEDLLTGRMKYLDYVNRAYSIPMYLHIAMQYDNEHGLAFWYTASTCRHLGIGGTHTNAAVREAQKGYMAKYRELKRFFTQGHYYAPDETIHLHHMPATGEIVALVFNFSDTTIMRKDTLSLPPELKIDIPLIAAGGVSVSARHLHVHAAIPPRGVRVVLLQHRDQTDRTQMIW